MKRKAFSLAELLVTVGILSIIIVCLIPAAKNIKPDTHKVSVLKIYDNIYNLTNTLLTTEGIYDTEYNTDDETTCIGLGCTDAPTANTAGAELLQDATLNNFNGNTKYAKLIAHFLEAPINNNVITLKDDTKLTFTYNSEGTTPKYGWVNLQIEMPNAKARNKCTYNKTNCPHPYWYTFHINSNGLVTPTDPLSRAYVRNQFETSGRDKDIEDITKYGLTNVNAPANY